MHRVHFMAAIMAFKLGPWHELIILDRTLIRLAPLPLLIFTSLVMLPVICLHSQRSRHVHIVQV